MSRRFQLGQRVGLALDAEGQPAGERKQWTATIAGVMPVGNRHVLLVENYDAEQRYLAVVDADGVPLAGPVSKAELKATAHEVIAGRSLRLSEGRLLKTLAAGVLALRDLEAE